MRRRSFKHTALLLIGILVSMAGSGQIQYDFGFKRDFSIPVYDSASQLLKYAWAGGFNAAHFNQVDLNQDGIKDLVLFDAQTDKLFPFINLGTAGVVDYHYAPEYESAFPRLYAWMKLRDFNGDGKEDIFTYGFAGIKVYLNTSTPSTGLSFSLYTPILNAFQGSSYSNILVTSVDYPAIEDIDGDGDLDILVFYGLGSLIQHYDNRSIDSTGTADTLWLVLNHRCWGWFAEDADDNSITLNIDSIDPTLINYCANNMKSTSGGPQSSPKHTGSTMQLLDLTGNQLMDMIIGDTDYPTVAALYNTGTLKNARMTSADTLFPSYDVPVKLYDLVSTDYLDVNNDGKRDLIASPLDPSWEAPRADDAKSAWWYKNISTGNAPVFSLQTRSFLQGDMIDVGTNSHPVLFDYNGDGLLDLFVGAYGQRDSSWMDPWFILHSKYVSRIFLFENTGTATQPEFSLVTDDFANVSSLELTGAYPTFGDINGDGKPDMILGDTTGRLHYYENIAPAGQPMQLNHIASNYQNIDVGMFSTPQLFDLDDDGLLDLIIGYKQGVFTTNGINYTWKTSLAWYKNTGTTTNPVFTHQTDTLGGVRVNDNYYHYYSAYSAPCFYRDSAGIISLFVGSGPGLVFYYRDINNNINGVYGKDSNMVHITDYDQFYSVQHFENQDKNAQTIDVKLKSVVTLGDLNNDGYPEMIVGNFGGGLNFFMGSPPLGIGIEKPMKAFAGEVNVFPNPASYGVNIAITGADRSVRSITSVYAITGQLLLQYTNLGDDYFRVDISKLSNGVYVMKVDVESEQQGTSASFNKKLVVKR
ncbi:MAG: FG-GAP-like repeat-containing protein [Bacteroidales bacterium]